MRERFILGPRVDLNLYFFVYETEDKHFTHASPKKQPVINGLCNPVYDTNQIAEGWVRHWSHRARESSRTSHIKQREQIQNAKKLAATMMRFSYPPLLVVVLSAICFLAECSLVQSFVVTPSLYHSSSASIRPHIARIQMSASSPRQEASPSSTRTTTIMQDDDPLLDQILQVAIDASKKAGDIILGNAGGAAVTERKANSRDLLTLIDPLCEKVCFACL